MRRNEADRRRPRRYAPPEFIARVPVRRRYAYDAEQLKRKSDLVISLIRQGGIERKVAIWWRALAPGGKEIEWRPLLPLPESTLFIRCYGDLA